LGIIYFKIGNYSEAQDNLTRSSQMNPDSPDVHLYLGRTFNATHQTRDAVEEYQASLQLDPNQPEAHKELGDLYQSEGRAREAEAEYQAFRKDVTPPPAP
jgi:tetratricopeptide (TPR) repeat protein